VVAGLSVAVLLIPQSLAYANLAGMPPYIGLYAAALPPLAAAFFASSPYLQTGPVALTALLTFGALSTVAPPGSPEYVALGGILALIVGITRIAIGYSKAGDIAFLMSEPVLRGFMLGAAILITASQLPGALGMPGQDGVIGSAVHALRHAELWDPWAVGLTALTLLLVLGGRWIHPMVPGVPLAAAAGLAATLFFDYPGAVLGQVPEGLPPLTLDLPWRRIPAVALAGVVIALVGFAEAATIARTYATRERKHWDPDKDFVSQGVANVAAAFSGGFPVGGSFSRSSLNHMIGAKTRWSGAVTGLVVLAFLPFAGVLSALPTAVLSAIVLAAVVGLFEVRPLINLWRISRPQFAVAAATLVLTVLLSPHIEQALVLGVLFSVGVHLWREFQVQLEAQADAEGLVLHLHPRGVLWFGSAEVLKAAALDLVVDHPEAVEVKLHMDRLGRVDLTAALVLEGLIDDLEAAGIEVSVVDVHPKTARALRGVLARARLHAMRRGGSEEPGQEPS
jgi:SulP family sulfate permease